MNPTITLPQGRIPLGWVMLQGQRMPVTIDTEWMQSLLALLDRSGGVPGHDISAIIDLLAASVISINDDKIDLSFSIHAAEIAELRKSIEDLKRQISMVSA